MVIQQFQKELGDQLLTPASTPAIDTSYPKFDTVDEAIKGPKQIAPTTGKFAKVCRKYIGCLLWIARASRCDITWAVMRLTRKAHIWSTQSDRDLIRTFQYLLETRDIVLEEYLDVRDRNTLSITCYTDADWGGDANTRKSTSGRIIAITGKNRTNFNIDHSCKMQTVIARSTAEAEIVAMSRCISLYALPTQLTMTALLKYEPHIYAYCDAAIAIHAIRSGISMSLRYDENSRHPFRMAL